MNRVLFLAIAAALLFSPAAALPAAAQAAAAPSMEAGSASAQAQAAAPAPAGWRALALFSGEGLDREAWTRSFESALLRSGAVASVRRASGDSPLAEEAARLGLDLAVEARAELVEAGEGASLRVAWAIYAPSREAALATGVLEASEEPELRYRDAFWDELSDAFGSALAGLGRGGLAALTLVGPPGTRVRGLGAEALVIPAEGELSLLLPAPATYAWRAAQRGRMPERGSLALGAEGGRLELEPEPKSLRPWRLESALLVAAYPDLWASWRFSEDRFYLRAGLYQYLFGLSLEDEDSKDGSGGDGSVFASYPLIQPGIGAGALFLRADSPLRPYAGASFSARLVLPPGGRPFLDPLGPVSLGVQLGLEWRPLERWSFFFEALGELCLLGDGELMAATRQTGHSSPIYGDSWFLDLPLMRFGARFAL